jgi:hypothetical protein
MNHLLVQRQESVLVADYSRTLAFVPIRDTILKSRFSHNIKLRCDMP